MRQFNPQSPRGKLDNPGIEEFLHNFMSQVTFEFDRHERIFGDARNIGIAVPSYSNDPSIREAVETSLQEALWPLLSNGQHSLIPKGTVIAYAGTAWQARTLRGGWGICDGTIQNGLQKPDLRHKFLRGAGAGEDSGGTGGSETQSFTIDAHAKGDWDHTHTFTGDQGTTSSESASVQACAGAVDVAACDHTHTFTPEGANDNWEPADDITHAEKSVSVLPPYYEVIFLIKL